MEIQELRNLDRIFDMQALECILRSVRISNAPDYPPSIIDYQLNIHYTTNWLIKKIESSYFIVALIDDTVVGTGALENSEIKHVFVDPDYQRRGVGRSLMEELERYAKNQGLKEVRLQSSITGLEFYKALKYQFVEQSEMEYQGDTIVTYLLKKCL